MSKLKELIRVVDEAAVKGFQEDGKLQPVYIIETEEGGMGVIPIPPGFSKDQVVHVMREIFKDMNVQRYVYVDEAWAVSGSKEEDKAITEFSRNNSLEHYPGRDELILYAAEDVHEGTVMAKRVIRRPDNGPAQLGDLEFAQLGTISGRMTGLLPHNTGRSH